MVQTAAFAYCLESSSQAIGYEKQVVQHSLSKRFLTTTLPLLHNVPTLQPEINCQLLLEIETSNIKISTHSSFKWPMRSIKKTISQQETQSIDSYLFASSLGSRRC